MQATGYSHEEPALFIIVLSNRHQPAEEFDDRIFLRMNLLVFLKRHFNARKNQERSKDINDPVELLNQRDPCEDKNSTHDECAENSPEQNLMLAQCGYPEVAEDQQEHENVVHAEGLLEQVAGEKFEGCHFSPPEINPHIEEKSKCDPDSTPDEGFFDFDDMRFAMKYAQV